MSSLVHFSSIFISMPMVELTLYILSRMPSSLGTAFCLGGLLLPWGELSFTGTALTIAPSKMVKRKGSPSEAASLAYSSVLWSLRNSMDPTSSFSSSASKRMAWGRRFTKTFFTPIAMKLKGMVMISLPSFQWSQMPRRVVMDCTDAAPLLVLLFFDGFDGAMITGGGWLRVAGFVCV